MEGEKQVKDVIKFFGFLLYTTTIFFLPNQAWLLLLFAFHILCMIFAKVSWKKSMIKTSKILPFILFTFIVNCYSNPKKGFNRGKRSLQSKENRVACKKYASHIR